MGLSFSVFERLEARGAQALARAAATGGQADDAAWIGEPFEHHASHRQEAGGVLPDPLFFLPTTTTTLFFWEKKDEAAQWCLHALCGGLAGGVARAVTHPLDTVKRRMQAQVGGRESTAGLCFD